MKSEKITPWIVVWVVSVFLLVIVLFKGDSLNNSIYSDYMDAYGDKEVPYALFVLPDGNKERVSFWWSEDQEAYILFTPGFWNEGDIFQICCPHSSGLGDRSDRSVSVDNQELNKGVFSLTNKGLTVSNLTYGIHDISFGESDSTLIVMKSSLIPSMMVEFDPDEYKIRDGEYLLDKTDKKEADSSNTGVSADRIISEDISSEQGTAEEILDEDIPLIDETYKVWKDARVRLIDRDGKVSTSGLAEEIRVRGNTSADWPKQPYQLTMKDSTDFLGMGSAKKWNLLSNWSDRTLLRNKITYDMAENAGLAFTPESQFVNLYINGQYQGCYQLSEKVEVGRNRVDITNLENLTIYKPERSTEGKDTTDAEYKGAGAKENLSQEFSAEKIITNTNIGVQICAYQTQLKTDDLTGGYLLELERPSRIKDSLSYFITKKGQPLTIRSPKYADVAEAEYISSYWQGFEDALFSENGINPGNGLSYLDYIDIDSFVKKYLIEEIVRNYDASSTSQYFYKEADGVVNNQDSSNVSDVVVSEGDTGNNGIVSSKIYAGPVWDYDMSLGNTIMNKTTNQKYVSSIDPYGIFAAYPFDDFSIWAKLYEKPEFYQAVRDDYKAVYLPLVRELLEGKLNQYAFAIRDSGIADLMRWGRLERSMSDLESDNAQSRQELMDSWSLVYDEALQVLDNFVREREHYLTAIWVEGKEPRKIYLDGGEADMYVAWVEAFEGEKVPMPVGDPDMEDYRFVGWNNGYTGEPYDFEQIYQGQDLYLEAAFEAAN